MKPLLRVKTEVDLSEVILSFLRRNGFPRFNHYDPLVRKYALERVVEVFKTGTDRDDNSSWHAQERYIWNQIKSGTLTPEKVTFLNSGLEFSLLYPRGAMSIYDPSKMLFVGGEGWMYTVREPYSFLDALIAVVVPENFSG